MVAACEDDDKERELLQEQLKEVSMAGWSNWKLLPTIMFITTNDIGEWEVLD
jgi:hypothetical protein